MIPTCASSQNEINPNLGAERKGPLQHSYFTENFAIPTVSVINTLSNLSKLNYFNKFNSSNSARRYLAESPSSWIRWWNRWRRRRVARLQSIQFLYKFNRKTWDSNERSESKYWNHFEDGRLLSPTCPANSHTALIEATPAFSIQYFWYVCHVPFGNNFLFSPVCHKI